MSTAGKKPLSIILILLCAAILFNTGQCFAAATNITLSENDYLLYVEEYPDNIYNEIFAKFKNAKANTDEYYLNLSSEESLDTFTSALKKSKISYNEDYIAHFNPALYKMTDDDDKKVTDPVELFIPLPDDAQEHPEDCSFFSVSGGSAKLQNTQLYVTSDSIYYIKLSLSSYTTYGFVYQDPYSYDEEDEEEEEEEEEDDYEEEEDEDYEDPSDASNDTPDKGTGTKKTDASSPTIDSNGKKVFTSGSDDGESKTTEKEAKATAAPTPKPTAKPKEASSGNTTKKSFTADPIPKTGDEFPVKLLSVTAIITMIILIVSSSVLFQRKKDQKNKNL